MLMRESCDPGARLTSLLFCCPFQAMECPADVAAISSCIRPQAKWAETMRLLSNEITTEGGAFSNRHRKVCCGGGKPSF